MTQLNYQTRMKMKQDYFATTINKNKAFTNDELCQMYISKMSRKPWLSSQVKDLLFMGPGTYKGVFQVMIQRKEEQRDKKHIF